MDKLDTSSSLLLGKLPAALPIASLPLLAGTFTVLVGNLVSIEARIIFA